MACLLISKRYSFHPHRFRSLPSFHVPRFYHSLDGAQLSTELYSDFFVEERQFADTSKWRTINAKLLGINGSMVPSPAWTVLRILRARGFEAYLVGGCVRDLLLNREPKDYDVITTAELAQVKKQFHRCHILGQRFPICRVLVQGLPVEVSSFETVGRHAEEKEKVLFSKMPDGFDEKDFIRWRDSMHRDFTINSLYYDPVKHKIYDYTNGMADLKTLELRTVIPAQLSFQEDCARILRGLRIAGRLGLSITKDTEAAMHELSSSVSSLGKLRTMMEMNYMLSYGAAESTISLLQRFGLLEKFLPFHTAYLDQQAREKSASRCMMMKLFSNLDRLFSCDRPCTSTVWIALLAFHQALVINPQDGLVLWAFASILYHGDWRKGIIFARENAKAQVVPEISGCDRCKSDEELAKEVAWLASLVQESVAALIDGESLSKYMSKYPAAPNSGFVFIPERTGNKAVGLFDELVNDIESIEDVRECFEINYHLLYSGDKHETRFALGKVVLETLREEVPKGLGILKKQGVIHREGYKLLKEEQKEVKGKEYMLLEEEQKDVEEKEYKVQKEVLDTSEEKAYPAFSHFIKQLAMVKDGMLETLGKGVFEGQKILKGEQEVIEEKGYPAVPHFVECLVASTDAKGSREPVEVVEEDMRIVKEGWKLADFSVLKPQGLVEENRQYPPMSLLEPKQDKTKKQQDLVKKHNRKVKVKHLKLHDEKTEDNAIVLENNSSNDVKIKHVEKKDHQPVPLEVARNKSKKLKKCWSMDSDVMKHRDLVEENRKHSLLPVMKSKQDKLNEKKLVNIENYSKEHMSEVRENKAELLDMKKFPEEELNESRGNSSEIRLLSGIQHLPQLAVTGEGHLTVKSEKQQDWTKKLTNKVQKTKHKMHDKESLQNGATVTKDITKKEKIKLEDEKDLPSSSQEDVKIGMKKVRETMILEKGDQPVPSLQEEKKDHLCKEVFRKNTEHFQAAFLDEKKVQSSLSEFFRR